METGSSLWVGNGSSGGGRTVQRLREGRLVPRVGTHGKIKVESRGNDGTHRKRRAG